MSNDAIEIPNAPAIPGLSFRHFRGPSDYPAMVAAIAASADADKVERVTTVEDVAQSYAHLTNCDPAQDMVFAEMHGEVIGYSRVWWHAELAPGPYLYNFVGFLVPVWRRRGIGQAVLGWLESRIRQIAASQLTSQPKFIQGFTTQDEVGLAAMLEKNGYQAVRRGYEMVRPSLEDLPDFPLPTGVELRPVLPAHYRAIWEADLEAFQDHWGYAPPTEEDYQSWLSSPQFQPTLWQIAWDVKTNEIAGQVRTFIDHPRNEKYGYRRGFTEFISVRRPWRKQGLARALIVRSLAMQKAQGMTESGLGVDSENLSGATRIYEACGFRVVKHSTVYRKAV